MKNTESFINEISSTYNIDPNSIIYQYLHKKTKAVNKGSKARRSLGNLYALYVLSQDFLNGNNQGSTFSELMKRMKSLPFGSKLQNHPLDNRLNDEMRRQYNLSREQLPVQPTDLGDGKKARKISIALLSENQMDSHKAAHFIVSTIGKYIEIIKNNQISYLSEVEMAKTDEEIVRIVKKSFEYNSDARLFEVVSYALLHLHYKQTIVTCSVGNPKTTSSLILYKTGRTNANDGGIDFVLKPLGKFFQVTETLDFKKYFLDFDKVNKFPMSFVVKTDISSDKVRKIIKENSMKNMNSLLAHKYMSLFDEIITNNELGLILNWIKKSHKLTSELKVLIIESFKLEYGLLD